MAPDTVGMVTPESFFPCVDAATRRQGEGRHERATSTAVPNPHVSLTLLFFFYLEAYKKNVAVLVLHITNCISRLNLHVQTHLHYTVVGRVLQKLSLVIFPV